MRKLLLLAVVALAIVGAGCNPTSPYAAKVNGSTISQADLNNELNAIHGDPALLNQLQGQSVSGVLGAGQDSFDSSFVARILNSQILSQLIHQEVVRRGITISGQDLRLARIDIAAELGGTNVLNALPASYQNRLVTQSANQTALEARLANVDVGPGAVAQYYAAHEQSYTVQCVSHILLRSQADAAAVRAQIVAGTSFADAARSQSLDTTTAAKGGSLGCGPTGRFTSVPQFEQAVNSAPTGQLTQPVQIQFTTRSGASQVGWDLILVTSRPPLPVEAVQPQIRAALLANARGPLSDTLRRIESNAHITLNPRYGTYHPGNGIAPPSAPPQSTLNFVPQGTTTTTSPLGP